MLRRRGGNAVNTPNQNLDMIFLQHAFVHNVCNHSIWWSPALRHSTADHSQQLFDARESHRQTPRRKPTTQKQFMTPTQEHLKHVNNGADTSIDLVPPSNQFTICLTQERHRRSSCQNLVKREGGEHHKEPTSSITHSIQLYLLHQHLIPAPRSPASTEGAYREATTVTIHFCNVPAYETTQGGQGISAAFTSKLWT